MNLLAPLGLLAGTLTVPLLALYFLKLRRRRVVVPSTLLWREVVRAEREARPFERFRKNLLLFVQLLALLLLTLAAARPFLWSDADLGSAVAIVIDTSASMGATDGSPDRLADAVAAATQALDRLASTDEAMLVVAGPTTDVRVPFTREHGLIRTALAGLRSSQAEASLRDGLQLALSMARSRPGVSLLVLSDGGREDLSDLAVGNTPVRFVPVGRSQDNAGIVALDVRRSVVSEHERQLFVTVRSFAGRDLPVTLTAFVDERPVGTQVATALAETPLAAVFDLPGTAGGIVRVELETPDDQLSADNVAYAVLTPGKRRRVLAVGTDALTTRALGLDPRGDVQFVASKDFRPEQLDAVDVAVFGEVVPPDLDGRDYLVLGPLPGAPVRFGDEAKAPVALGWRRSHPTMRFVEWADVRFARSQSVVDGGGLAPIVEGDAGPLVLAGERSEGRVIQLAFDPLETDLPLRVAWPVFLLNSVAWLSEGAGGGDGGDLLPTGTAFTRRAPDGLTADRLSATGPAGAAVPVQLGGGLLRVRDTDRVGIYVVNVGDAQAKFAANLLSPRESHIAPQSELSLGSAEGASVATPQRGQREIWRELGLAALAIVMLEWLLWNLRRVA